MATQITAYRLSEETLKKIDELSTFARITRTKLITQLVDEAYDKINGNPKLKSAMEDLQRVNELLEQLDYKLNS